ncbi:DUF3048 domain-containing protein [Chloroflexi bacterium TSY]|nr:DUF3048 domain-containing protein [Chloroflexi bacterium TSY]
MVQSQKRREHGALIILFLSLVLVACGRAEEPTLDQLDNSISTSPTFTSTPALIILVEPTATPTKIEPSVSGDAVDATSKSSLEIGTGPKGIVQAESALLYAKPTESSDVMGLVTANTTFDIVGTTDDSIWLLVCCPAGTEVLSWIRRDSLIVDGDFAAISVISVEESTVQDDVQAVTEQLSEGIPDDRGADGALSGTISGDLVNVRGGPGTNYAVLGQVTVGNEVDIVGSNEDRSWWRVCCPVADAEESWIAASLIALEPVTNQVDLLAAVPVVPAPPVPEIAISPAGGTGGPNDGQAAALAAAPSPGLPGAGGFGAPGGTNPLTGLGLPAGRGGQRPIIVCINNDFATRPQFGTSQADVMYEYLMEGYGITRFSGVFYGDDVGQIGPVRSARLINYYMGALYNAGLACSGASDGVRFILKHQSPFPYMDVDLDDPSNTRYSSSIGSDYRTRLRTDTGRLRRWLADWGVETPASLRGFTFGGLAGGGRPATNINIPYPGGSRSSYQYDGGSGRYLRFLGRAAHVDGNTGAQLSVENVIIQYVPHETTDIVEDSLGSLSIRLNLFGSGRAIVFRDGQAFEGTWRSDSLGDMPRFFGPDGSEVPLKPGRSWISVVPFNYTIGY